MSLRERVTVAAALGATASLGAPAGRARGGMAVAAALGRGGG
jgi:hypothetical protein